MEENSSAIREQTTAASSPATAADTCNYNTAPVTLNLPKTLSFVNLKQNAQRAGFLLKYEKGFFKRIFGRTWQRKYCILSGCHFYWFKNKQGREKSNGVINLRYFDRCGVPDSDKHANIPHVFQLASSQNADHHAFLFQADSEEEQQRWLKDIQLVIFQCQTQGRTGTSQRVIGARPSSRTASPILPRTAGDHDERQPRRSSIPEQGASGTYRSVGPVKGENSGDDSDVFLPQELPISRSESRNTKPDLVPRMPTYNQVVNELQSRLHSRTEDTPDHPGGGILHTSSRTSPVGAYASIPSPSSADDATSPSSTSVSSYDNTPDTDQPTPLTPSSVKFSSPELLSPGGTSIEARFDSVLKMMEDLTEDNAYANTKSGPPEYAQPFAKYSDTHHGPAVPPKPKREMYEQLLASNQVAPYLVSPVVNVSG